MTTPERAVFRCDESDELTAAYLAGFHKRDDEVQRLTAELEDIREREAAACPEDFGFDEYIRILTREHGALRAQLDTAANLRREETPTAVTDEKLHAALAHVADELAGQLTAGTLRGAEHGTRVYWRQVLGVARAALREAARARPAPNDAPEARAP